MKYNIATVSNETYSPFLNLFLKSLFDNAACDHLHTVFVFDTGLSAETKQALSINEKIEFVDTGVNSSSSKIHDDGWKQSTYLKIDFLYNALKTTNEPCFMIDVDSVFQSSFESLITWDADFACCLRATPRAESSHIGSFFGGITVNKSLLFLKIWAQQMYIINNDPNHPFPTAESPALTKTLSMFSEFFTYQEIGEDQVSCIKENDSASIYHLKSDSYALTIEDRIKLKYADHLVKKYV